MYYLNEKGVDRYVTYSREERPYGKSWEEWTAKWWVWVLSFPKEINPGNNITGDKHIHKQSDPNVFFLVGTFGGSANRDCIIPYGKSCLFPIINFTTSYSEEPFLKTESELIQRAKKDIDDIYDKEASIDGRMLTEQQKIRIASQPFNIIMPQNNVFGAKPGLTRAVSDGYWVFLKPLNPGFHVIYTLGACSSGKTKVEVNWNIRVVPPA